jgi:hypothetical protein
MPRAADTDKTGKYAKNPPPIYCVSIDLRSWLSTGFCCVVKHPSTEVLLIERFYLPQPVFHFPLSVLTDVLLR